MKFIELSPNVCANVDFIEYIASENDGNSSLVHMRGKDYKCVVPYRTMIGLVQDENAERAMKKLDKYLDYAPVTAL